MAGNGERECLKSSVYVAISSQAARKRVEGSTTTVGKLKTPIDVAAVTEMAKTMSCRAIADVLGVDHRTLGRHMKSWGVSTPSWRKLPSNNEVIALYKAGMSLEQIQRTYGGCPRRVLELCGVKRRPARRKAGVPLSEAQRAAISAFRRGNFLGENNPNWRGGKGPKDQKERASYKSKEWSKAVRSRDGHKCQHCGISEVKLHAHHIQPWKLVPELRFDVSNGITLCQPCHMKVHNFVFPWVHAENGTSAGRRKAMI